MNNHISLIATFLIMTGCATDPVPSEQLRLTEQALMHARAAGASAQSDEWAAAQRKLAEAIAAIKREDYRAARLHAEQAELDARLAEAKALTDKSRLELTDLNRRIAGVRQQLGDMR